MISTRGFVNFALFGQRMAFIRRAQGHTQSEIAARVGISTTQLNRFEIATKYAPESVRSAIADTLGVSLDEIQFAIVR